MKVGFIGTGSMGTILIESFIQSGALQPEHIIATNRTTAKAQVLADRYPGIQIIQSIAKLAEVCDLVFICVKPMEFKHVIAEIAQTERSELIVVSITSPVLIQHLEGLLSCKIAKIIPSITNYVHSGASICIYGSRIEKEDQEKLEQLMASISRPIQVSEQFTRMTSDLSSIGPAFIAFFMQRWIDAAVEKIGINQEEATRLASEMLLGTGKLLTEGNMTLEQLQQRVAVPGGITAEALRLLDNKLADVFNQLIDVTHAKYDEDVEKVSSLLSDLNLEADVEAINRQQC